jgi:hypothetical protein
MVGDITILGNASKALRSDIGAAVPFYLDILLPGTQWDSLKKNLSIEIVLNDSDEDGSAGWTLAMEEDHYVIELYKDFDGTPLLQTLAHEMVHVKQYATGELREKMRNGEADLIWKNRRWSPPEGQHEYWDCPWEIEAFGREYGLYKRFTQSQEK